MNKKRLDFVRRAFAVLGIKGDELEMRTLLLVCYQSWESPTFREILRKRQRQLIARRIDLLTRRCNTTRGFSSYRLSDPSCARNNMTISLQFLIRGSHQRIAAISCKDLLL